MTMGAFAVVFLVAQKHELRLGLSEYGGLGWKVPVVGITMTVFLLSLAGVPPTGGFWGKFAILRAAVEQRYVWLAVFLVLTSLVSYYYYLRVAWYMWFREPDAAVADRQITVSPGMRVALIVAAVAVLLLGIFPAQILDVAQHSATALLEVPLSRVVTP
jgi:NADH-quinone oxidoreductase subunit N